ncbi:MAG: glycine cleavage system protein H [Lentisphaerae bacterium GWF2_44_16]|nr:MAG: glycine cleavage system protein H [Lentisphaerae bacterium GWF2_44_16]
MKYYSKEHEWVRIDGEVAVIGISEHAAHELGDITYVEPPAEDADLIVGDPLGVVESVKAASDVYAPISGTVCEVNSELEEDPGIINSSPEDKGWICKIENFDLAELEELMDEKAYAKYLKELK